MRRPSFAGVLLLLAGLFILLFFVVLGAGVVVLEGALRHDQYQRLAAVARLLEPQPGRLLSAGDRPALQRWCRGGGERSGYRLTVADGDGAVVADSRRATVRAGRLAPAVGAAVRAGRLARLRVDDPDGSGQVLMVVLPLYDTGGDIPVLAGALLLATPVARLHPATVRLLLVVAVGLVLVALAVGVVARRLAGGWDRHLALLRSRLAGLAAGEIDGPPPAPADGCWMVRGLAEVTTTAARLQEAVAAHQAELAAHHHRLVTLFDAMAEAVLVVDRHRRVVRANRAALRLFGVTGRSITGRTMLEIARSAELEAGLHQLLEGAPATVVEAEVSLANGDATRHLQLHGVRLPAGDGALLVFNDVSRLKRLEEARQRFVANVSHELKTPITTIRGFLETLLEGAADDVANRDRFLAIALKHTQRLQAIIDDLLVLSRIEQGEGEMALLPQPLAPILERSLEMCRPRAAAAGVALHLDCAADLQVACDGPLLEQAVINLVINAVHHGGPPAHVWVSGGRRQGWVEIRVADDGVGIDRRHLEHLFERFYRADKARSRSSGGTGLGLAIVKHIVQAHHGRVEVTSRVGEGSVFSVVLPADAADEPAVDIPPA